MWAIKVVIFAIAGFFLVSLALPSYWNWSVLHIPSIKLLYYMMAVAAIGLTISVRPTRNIYKYILKIVSICHNQLNKLSPIVRYILAAVVIGAILYLLRSNSYILGDGNLVVNALATKAHISSTAFGFSILIQNLGNLFGIDSLDKAFHFLSLTSILCGVVCLLFLYNIFRELIPEIDLRLMLFLTAVTSGIMILFTGYIETYPILTAWLAVYIYYSIKFSQKKIRIIFYLLIYLLGVFWHLWFIIFLPSFLYAVNNRYRIISNKIVIAISALYVIGIYLAGQFLTRGDYLMTVPISATSDSSYTLFSPAHLIDIFNELIIVGSILAIFFPVALIIMPKARRSSKLKFLLYAGIPAFFAAYYIDPILGAVRDWDVLSIFAIPFIIAGAVLLAEINKTHRYCKFLIIPILILNLMNTSGFIANITNNTAALDRVIRIVKDDPHYQGKYYEGMRSAIFAYLISDTYGRYTDAVYFLKKRGENLIPNLSEKLYSANIFFNARDYKNANIYYRDIYGKMKMSASIRFVYGKSLLIDNRPADALPVFRDALLDTTCHELYYCTGIAQQLTMHNDSAYFYFELGLRNYPDTVRALGKYATFLESAKQPGFAAYYQSRLFKIKPDSTELLQHLVRNFELAGYNDSAIYYRSKLH